MSWPDNPESPTDSEVLTPESSEWLSTWLRLYFLDSYVRWRAACEEVRLAYECWGSAERRDRGLAFAAFCAALDREGHAASVHADCVRQIREAYSSDPSPAL